MKLRQIPAIGCKPEVFPRFDAGFPLQYSESRLNIGQTVKGLVIVTGLFIGGGGEGYGEKQFLTLKYANRHGLIAGATGTGKTVTLQILAEGFSNAGVPVFLSDVKGDLSGACRGGICGFQTA